MRNLVLKLSLVVVLVLYAGFSAIGQTITGDIVGTVTDPSGAVVAGAKVTATNVATNVATSATTNQDGVYSIRFLQIGTYKVSVTSKGFTTLETTPFLLEVAQVAKVDAKLKLGSEASVQVNSQLAPILNTENGTISTNIPATLINDLPVNGHSFMELAQFAPGVSVGDQNQWNGATGSPNNSGERPQSFATLPNINGNRTYNNNYYIDGIENTDSGADLGNGFGEPIYDPDPDSLESVNIFTSSAPAEFGNATGGQIVSVLKSGTNQFHGSASGYLQNYLMDANTFGNKRNYNVISATSTTPGTITPRSPYTQTIYSGTFGGPVVIPKLFNGKNKLFFFADYQGYFKPSGSISQTNVALNAWRGNTTSNDPNDPSVSPLAGYAYFGSALGKQLYDSQNGFAPFNQTINGTTYQNLVPIKNPVATYLFAHPNLYPLANTPITGLIQNGYTGTVKSLTENNQFDVKMDYSPTDNDRISGSFSYSNAHDGQSQFLTPVSFPTLSYFPYKALRLNYVHTFSASVVNEFRIGLTRNHYNQLPATNASFGANGDGVVGINFPNQTALGFTQQGFSVNGAQGINSFGTSSAFNTGVDNTFQYEDNLTILRGHHTIKAGAQLIRYQNNYFPGANYGGALGTQSYTGLFTGDPAAGSATGYDFADFVLGYVSSLTVSQSIGDVGEREYRSAVFAQDDWKITPTLTLNLGLRYQYTQPVYEVNNKISNINLATGAIVLAGQDGNSRSLYSPVHNEFNPRLGFAWQERPRLVIRGGLGITTFMDFNALSHTGNFPFTAKVAESAVNPTTTSGGTPFFTANGFPTATGTNTNYTAWTNLKPQFETQYDLVSEYELSNTSSLTLAYVGNFANRLLDVRNPNQWTLIGTPSSAPYFSTLGKGSVNLYESEGASNFNAAEVSYRQRPTQGLELIVNYTYSKNLADTTGPIAINDISGTTTLPEDSYDLHREYGPVGSDQRHQFNGIANYALPFGSGKRFFSGANRAVDEAIGGWKVSASSVLLGGFPLAIRAGSTGNILGGGGYIRAHQYRKMKIVGRKYGYIVGNGPNSAGVVGNYLQSFPNNEVLAGAFGTDPSATHSNYIGAGTCNNSALQQDDGSCAYGIPFVLTEATGQAPNFNDTVRIGTERAPAFRGVDGTLSKDFRVYETNTLQFRCNAYNLGNITSYNNPNVIINGSNNWGIVQSTRSQQRTLELQLTYKF
ncbi:carboxypeptidase regulatory-like domain-containing protein [Granulicella aggregans]|jgi:hypothetical protein|uniref:carboxypeptidase regulatory-like domain-containing protein n=1 Tax=Granulicella aggregans TaxID=474949 RepID=UPI0021E078B5|nr:carboxypeptidase regulatory-like domain-containing protein [Granulicella aggregans]